MMRRRLIAFSVLMGLAAAGALARLTYLQIWQVDELRQMASRQHRKEVSVPATRGSIVDRRGHELATTLKAHSLNAHPHRIEDKVAVADLLSGPLGIPRHQIRQRLEQEKKFVFVERALEPAQTAAIRELPLRLGYDAGLNLVETKKRYYPGGPLGMHVIGMTDIDGRGIEGIEKRYDKLLSGEPTVYLTVNDAQGNEFRSELPRPRRRPRDVVLNLDAVLQYVTERELDRAMRATAARSASAVLIDPATGEVLALANRPTADLDHYNLASAEALSNRAVWHQFEPGSTFKIVAMAAALEHRVVKPGDTFDCEHGSYALPSRRIRDSTPHGRLSASEVIEVSSNIGMVKLCSRLSPEQLSSTIDRFGFGRRTEIELGGEIAGAFKAAEQWDGFTRASVPFGHEISVTPVQMALAFATVANRGVGIPPRLVRGFRDQDGSLELAPRPAPVRVVRAAVADQLTSMLEAVVLRGTGRRAAVPGYRVAGKTGTAQKLVEGRYSDREYMASFGGFAPASQPRLAAFVVLDTPRGPVHQGGQVAAPVFGRIMADALRHLRIPPDATDVQLATLSPARSGDAARLPAAPGTSAEPRPDTSHGVPDVRGLSVREAVSRLAASGCHARVDGIAVGVVVEQHPAGGRPLPEPRVCRLQLADRRS